MLNGLLEMVDGEQLLLFARLFCSQPSTYLWDDDAGTTHRIHSKRRGEQGDAWMPLLFSLGQHAALNAISASLLGGEKLFAFHDDLYVACQPHRVLDVHQLMSTKLWAHSKISLHHGKTKIWNRGGICPKGCGCGEETRLRQLDSKVSLCWGHLWVTPIL